MDDGAGRVMTDEFEPTIRQLPSAKTTPDTVLGRTLSKRDHIKAVFVTILWSDDSVSCDWSTMRVMELSYMARHAEMVAADEMVGRGRNS